MNTTEQHVLFPLPNAASFDLTEQQRRVLDWLVFIEDRSHPGAFPEELSRVALRNLIDMGLVNVVGLSPGRYRLTEIGRAARSKVST